MNQTQTTKLLDDLATSMQGDMVLPSDDRYEQARQVWNGMIDLYPAAVAQCASTEDVRLAVNAARSAGLDISVRGGGHSVAGFGTIQDGLVIDLSPMRDVVVDTATQLVRAGGGCTLGNMDAATQAHGLVVPSGLVSKTGISGLTLSGGFGWLRRKWGLSCDNLVGATLVTAAGEVIDVSEESEPEILWGLRGGGGNFGVVTELVFQAYPLGPEVAFSLVFYPIEIAQSVLVEHERLVQAAGDEVSTLCLIGRVPAAESFPAALHRQPIVGVVSMYAGPASDGEAALSPLRQLGEPLLDMSGPMPYAFIQTLLDPLFPDGDRYYWKSTNVDTLSEDAIDIVMQQVLAAPSKRSTINFWLNGGAVERVGESDTAFSGRNNRYVIAVEANWNDHADDDANVEWAREVLSKLEPYGSGGAYLNFPGFLEEGQQLVQSSHGPNYPRLQALKQRLDPDNVFHRNANVQPAS